MGNKFKVVLLVFISSMISSVLTSFIIIKHFDKDENINTKSGDVILNETQLPDENIPLFNSGDVNYDNSESGIQSDNVKGAIDELYACASDYSAYDTRLGNVESNKSDKAATVSTVGWDSTNKKLTKTINGTTTDIVTGENLLANSGVTAGSYGPSANATPGYGSTFNVPYITVDAKGRVTAASTKTVTIPASDNTNTTYSAASSGGLSLSSNAFSIANSGVTAGSYGPSANATPGYGSTFNVPYITVNAKGQVTAASTKTVTIPASDKVTVTNNLTSTSTTNALSAAQGKILNDKFTKESIKTLNSSWGITYQKWQNICTVYIDVSRSTVPWSPNNNSDHLCPDVLPSGYRPCATYWGVAHRATTTEDHRYFYITTSGQVYIHNGESSHVTRFAATATYICQ